MNRLLMNRSFRSKPYLCGIMLIFPASSLLTNEFEKIKEWVSSCCISPMGKEKLALLAPQSDFEAISRELALTAEAYNIVSMALPFPTSGYADAGRETAYLKAENSVLSEQQLVVIRTMVRTAFDISAFFKHRSGEFPLLTRVSEKAPVQKVISELIDGVLDENGVVMTNASPDLARIRRSLSRSRAEADRIYASVIGKYRKNGWLTESEESSRNGRRVIAIVAEQKRTLRGVVHDLSATGKTAFLEPEEAVGINHSIQTLESEEKQEIIRILRELSKSLRKFVPEIQLYREKLGTFDFLMAKAAFAVKTDARFPNLSRDPAMHLIQARHPLLLLHNKPLHKPTVPFDLELGKENRILVISGPNAGGKTVCMKTSGLLQMMVQSGLPVTAHEDSTLGIFENILVDIGDSQSIEYELSTYSSRLKHMRIFLEKVSNRSLFLIDEFGTGTDPNLGGALAEAVLEALNSQQAIGIITTHYLNLKVLADRTEGIINGSMEFDLKRLRPLYKLHVGKPGSSYTFLVAERSGLPRDVIRNARRKVSRKHLMLEKLLTDVEHEKEQLKSRTAEAAEKEKQLKSLLKREEEHLKQSENTIRQKEEKLQKLEARLTRENEERFRNFMKEWKKAKDKKTVVDKYYRQFVRKKTDDSKLAEKKRAEKLAYLKKVLKPGSLVRIENSKTTGTVEKIDGETVFVIFGGFRTKCEMDRLESAEKVS